MTTRARIGARWSRRRSVILPQKENIHVALLIVFFFQAEDGIRDYKVTGVQTCALPIYTAQGFGADRFLRGIRPFQGVQRRPMIRHLRQQFLEVAAPHAAGRSLLEMPGQDRKSTRLNSSHLVISYAVFCLNKKKVDVSQT